MVVHKRVRLNTKVFKGIWTSFDDKDMFMLYSSFPCINTYGNKERPVLYPKVFFVA